MNFAKKVTENTRNASWIRRMFEKGAERAAEIGIENVFDFSIGNPFLEPPKAVFQSIEKHYNESGIHRYMPNAGFLDVREKIAQYYTRKTGVGLGLNNVVMTSGAAGALNIVLKSIINPGDEVIVLAPYFVEYGFYVENVQGKLVVVKTEENFQPNVADIMKHVTVNTKAIIINTPNNPTGVIYQGELLQQLNEAFLAHEAQSGNCIYPILDEPYAAICYDGNENPNTFHIFKNAIYCNSMSKTLGLAGERIGFVITSPYIQGGEQLIDNLVFANRTLGFGNANALFQKVVGDCLDARVDLAFYERNKALVVQGLKEAGYCFTEPAGAFYIFVKVPEHYADDVAFCDAALGENILLVPGIGFGYSGYVRLSFCVETQVIERAFQSGGFQRLIQQSGGK